MIQGRAIQRPNPHYTFETVSRVYPHACSERGESWSDCEIEIVAGSPSRYELSTWLGTGKYSDVFLGLRGEEKVALKVMKPVRVQKYQRELKILENLRGGVNIIDLIEVVQNPVTQQYTMVFEYIDNADPIKLYQQFSDMDAQFYLYQLMKALKYSHSHGIMHRDIKPLNILFDPNSRKLRLIDWGLAEFYHPKQRYNIHVASRHFKAPELLVDYQCYDYSVDIWSFGVTMAGILFGKTPFFKADDDFEMVAVITEMLGREELNRYLKVYGIELPEEMLRRLPTSGRRKDFATIRPIRGELVSPAALNLIERCLMYDHMTRISADQALRHKYFRHIRQELGE
jgi:casein kinase II subunit alpha